MDFDPTEEALGAQPLDIDATDTAKNRAIIPVDMAGESVTEMVKANARVILGTKIVGAQRIRDSRNALSESMFSHYELVSMLAVALDRLAVFEALTPTPEIEKVTTILEGEFKKYCPATLMPTRTQIRGIARAVLDK
jgi:hypothetical protein